MTDSKETFINAERIKELWLAFLSKLALKADKSEIALTLKDYMTESEVNQAITNAVGRLESSKFTLLLVEVLPETGEPNIMYLVPNNQTEGNNLRDEYIWVNGKFEIIGSTGIDLSNYWSKDTLQVMTDEELANILK